MGCKSNEKAVRIAVATGTRADWGLLLPLARELRNRGADVSVIATNMHLLESCGHTIDEIVADGFIPEATVPTSGDAPQVTAQALEGFARVLDEMKPDLMIILGDRFEMLGAASAALLSGVPLVHIAGGTVSEGAFDDSIRHSITKMASLHLVETENCRHRVIQMGENPADVVTAGALGVYNIMNVKLMEREELERSLGFSLGKKPLLVTMHAATLENTSPAVQMKELLTALEPETAHRKIVITYPNNDVDAAPQIRQIEDFAASHTGRVLAIPSLGRVRYLSMLRLAGAVVGNSSSGLVEVPSAGIPTLDIGIRQTGRECGDSVVHCRCMAPDISAGLKKVLSEEMQTLARESSNPYFRENTPEVMADAILSRDWHPFPKKRFHEL